MKGGSEDMAKMEMNADQPGKVTTNDEAAMVKEMQKRGSQAQGPVTNAGQSGQTPVAMNNQKFTGAPVENNQPALNGLLTHKTQDTFSKVLARMANSKF